jgi:hypothetical protein
MKSANKVQTRGVVVYEGPSVLDGSPIVVIAVLKSKNGKTGDMVQTFIIRADMSPLEASRTKLDDAICGHCPHRWSVGGACYVNLGQAPTSVYRAYKTYLQAKAGTATSYLDGTTPEGQELLYNMLQGRKVRLGTYGDPAAVPVRIIKRLADWSVGHTGYTHQIRHKNFNRAILNYCMVSADTVKSAESAWAQKARTFRIVTDITQIKPGEIECLSDSHGTQCIDCMLCDGKNVRAETGTDSTTNQTTKPKPNIAIVVHGSRAGRFLNNKAA